MKRFNVCMIMILLLVATLVVGCKTTEVNLTEEEKLDIIFTIIKDLDSHTEMNVVKQSAVGQHQFIDIDPLVIGETWNHIITVPYDERIIELYYRNPDQDAPIQFATLFVDNLGRIPGYSYMINGRINTCLYIVATHSYESTWDDLEDKHRAQWKADYEEYFELGGV